MSRKGCHPLTSSCYYTNKRKKYIIKSCVLSKKYFNIHIVRTRCVKIYLPNGVELLISLLSLGNAGELWFERVNWPSFVRKIMMGLQHHKINWLFSINNFYINCLSDYLFDYYCHKKAVMLIQKVLHFLDST